MGMPKLFGVLMAVAFGIALGILKYQLIVKTLRGDHVAVEISTLILAVVLQAGVVLVFGDSSKILLPIIPGVVYIAGVPVTLASFIKVSVNNDLFRLGSLAVQKTQALARPVVDRVPIVIRP